MCGIAGFLDLSRQTCEDNLRAIAARMAARLRHRGPDDDGVWADAAAGVALGHRRLAILDLSPLGHQPMASSDGRYVVVFNGEIYNFRSLAAELAGLGHVFRGRSDTEVLLAATGQWGVREALGRLNGMFAFALWDGGKQTLYLARDRMGEKPLYYWCRGGVFLFGSELKALRAHPAFRAQLDREALALYLRHNYIPAPYSVYQGVRKLPPGTWLEIAARQDASHAAPQAYWSLREAAERGLAAPYRGREQDAVEELEVLLRDAVRLRLESDVPLGAFLSGGVDSSAIVALMQAESARRVRTFTIGFDEPGYDEAPYAREVARRLGADHTELRATWRDALDLVPRLPEIYDEPFADSSQIPTVLLSQLTRRHVTVSLSGDGGDELFGGYRAYAWARAIERWFGWMPRPLRRGVARALDGVNGHAGPAATADRLRKLGQTVAADSPRERYRLLVSHWAEPAALIAGSREPSTVFTDPGAAPERADLLHRMMYLDSMTYLPDDILVKVDRASMSASLEARVPLLDHRVVEFAWRLPRADGNGKKLLRRLLARRLPPELVERPKAGFAVPVEEWLRGPLRGWAEELLEEKRLRAGGLLEPGPVREKWAEHLGGRRWGSALWGVLMLQAWLAAD